VRGGKQVGVWVGGGFLKGVGAKLHTSKQFWNSLQWVLFLQVGVLDMEIGIKDKRAYIIVSISPKRIMLGYSEFLKKYLLTKHCKKNKN